ncbi:MAG: SusC/RagA family TonB-linked outer membrane protein [Gemmatimonadaceae bacterium]
MMVASTVVAQTGTTISGRVTNESGAPIPGASVFIPTLNIGSQTNDNGQYSFVVAGARANGQTATLTARVIGYTARSVSVRLLGGSSITENFSLVANPLRLGEIVVTGAGTSTTRERLTSTINTVDSTALRRAIQPQNVVSALAAQAPNVVVRTQSGEPGASAYIQIRGASSVTGTNQPLFVVDGQPIDNATTSTNGGDASTVSTNRASDINPADIESIQILKGGAAAAIYGARASNGVVLITTKRGHAGPTRYTFSSTNVWDTPRLPDLVQTSYGQGNDGVTPTCAAVNCRLPSASWGAPIAPGTPVFNHQSELFDTGITSDNNLQVSGGSDRTTFFASGGLNAQNGYFKGPNNKYNRATVRLKGTQQVSSKLTIGANLSYIDDRGNYVQKGSNTSGLMLGALRTPPEYNNENTFTTSGVQRPYRFPNPGSAQALANAGHYDNPFFVLANPANKNELGRSIANVNADWNALDWLDVKETLGADYYSDWRLEGLPFTSASQPLGQVTRFDINNLEIDHNLTATAKHSFGDNLDMTVTLGQNLNSRRYRDNFDLGVTLIAPEPLNLQNTVKQTATEFRSLRHVEAYFGQAEFNLFNQLVVNVGLRNDGFSTFGAANPRANYPKAAIAWTFTNWLNHGNNTGWLSYGKLHLAYGETGREPPVYAAVNGLAFNGIFVGGYGDGLNSTINGQGGVSSSFRIGNPDLRPERDRETEFGGDFAFFNSKADLSATYYDKRSSDVILAVPVSASVYGATSRYANAAAIRNQGVELTLNLHPIQKENLAWDLGIQFGRNHGDVTSLGGAQFIEYNNEGFTGAIGSSTVGYAPGVIRGADFVRCGRGLTLDDGTNVDNICGVLANKQHALYLGSDGLPIADPTERVIADPNPKYTMSYNTSVKLWNKLTLSGLLDVRKGGSVWNGTKGVLNTIGTGIGTDIRNTTDGQFGKNFLTNVYPHVAGPGATGNVVAFKTPTDWENWFSAFCNTCTGNGGGFGPVSQQFVEDGGFVKLRELSATYTLDQRWVRSLTGFTSADLTVAGRNLHTWTRYTGFDPEANLGGGEFLTQGLDYFINPQVRSFVVSIRLNR